MSPDRTRSTRASATGRPQTTTLARVAVVLVTILVTTSTVAAATATSVAEPSQSLSTTDSVRALDTTRTVSATSQTDENTTEDVASTSTTRAASNQVDVVFVMDSSDSMNTERYQLANELKTFQRTLLERDVDARFGLVTYTSSATVRQPFTSNFDAIERAMVFSPAGSTERASDAILKATEMNYRSDAERVIVLITDEDDDSDADTRARAVEGLEDYTFLSVSPSTVSASTCDVHSPPCDSSADNELRVLADDIDGDWLDIGTNAERTMERVATNVFTAVDAPENSDGDDSQNEFEVGPNIKAIEHSVNRTEIETGETVEFNVTLRNKGLVEGTHNLFLTTNGELLAEKRVTVDHLSETTTSLVYRFDEPGDYKMVLSNERVDVVHVNEPYPMSIDVTTNDAGDRLQASVADANAGTPVTVDLPAAAILAGTGNQLTSVTVDSRPDAVGVRHDLAFDLTLERIEAPPAGTPAIESDARAVRYLSVTSSLSTADLRSVTFEFLKSGDDVEIHRYDAQANEWQQLTQQSVDGAPGHVVASTERLSTFALVVDDPALSVGSVDVGSTNVTEGDLVTASVTVTNNGTRAQSYDATVSLDGESVETKFVEVPAGETTTIPISFVAADAGTYDLAVAGVEQGQLQVDPAPTTSEPTTAAPTVTTTGDATDEPAGDSTPGFSIVVALVALLAAALVVSRRR
ncbi:PGF-CTERM sorting domain-containing protein [Halorubellus sp. PRR65]|uniref:PGF-CTERM sorting domain-containing protein n=1 Tax=Halorubellus sp. PRR65 TaxID=3098148 RepID=UPI002B257592|nr:PGF-CTERM sorting domain-containing protein [Halorubellus sp. PRR65]